MTARLLRWIAVLTLAVLGVVLTACSGDSTTTSDGPTHDIVDARGTTVAAPVNPQRVVTLAEGALDGALALGVKPVGTTSGRGQQGIPSYLTAQAGDIPIVASTRSPNLQQILKLHPDLILVDDTTGARNSLDELSKIAPTILVAKYTDGWEKYFDSVATALNKPAEKDRVIADVNSKIAATTSAVAKQRSGSAEPTASVVRWAADGPTIVGGNSLSSWVLDKVGMVRPAKQQAINSANRSGDKVSLENLDLIDADYLFFGALAGRQQAQSQLAQARSLPGFSSLGAVRANRVFPVDGTPWTSGAGPLGVQAVLADVNSAVS